MDIQHFGCTLRQIGLIACSIRHDIGVVTEIVPQSKGVPKFVGGNINFLNNIFYAYAMDECHSTSSIAQRGSPPDTTNRIATIYHNEIDIL